MEESLACHATFTHKFSIRVDVSTVSESWKIAGSERVREGRLIEN